ncbi:TIGR04086 family membrane protein [Aminipila terrae]|uniref:TIGR04086 family membrane protein n=1 Tax=Aminipila terrae TaxID=2697030 RepID=A0A6P1MG56_9FIRM|nr:TIGR04086 family membrane protein [Aminipila terrae]QHI73680.1 TIGR04086 family membrane protein [Aminipila terrae]
MNYVYKLLKGYLIAFIIFFILTAVITLFIKFTSTPENLSVYYLITAMCAATLFLGIFSGKLIGRKGLLSAIGLSGIFVFFIIFTINCTYFQDLTLNSFNPQYLFPVAVGGIGGIIGVNAKK